DDDQPVMPAVSKTPTIVGVEIRSIESRRASRKDVDRSYPIKVRLLATLAGILLALVAIINSMKQGANRHSVVLAALFHVTWIACTVVLVVLAVVAISRGREAAALRKDRRRLYKEHSEPRHAAGRASGGGRRA